MKPKPPTLEIGAPTSFSQVNNCLPTTQRINTNSLDARITDLVTKGYSRSEASAIVAQSLREKKSVTAEEMHQLARQFKAQLHDSKIATNAQAVASQILSTPTRANALPIPPKKPMPKPPTKPVPKPPAKG